MKKRRRTTVQQERELVAAVSQTTAAEVLGFASSGSLRALVDAPRRPDGAYDLRALVPWFIAKRVDEEAPSRDPLLSGAGDSPSLERYRAAKARLTELDVAERERQLIQVDAAREVLGRWASILRRAGERLQKGHGREAAMLLNEALDECRDIATEFDSDAATQETKAIDDSRKRPAKRRRGSASE